MHVMLLFAFCSCSVIDYTYSMRFYTEEENHRRREMSCEKDWEAYERFLREEELADGTIKIYIRQAKLLMQRMEDAPLTKERLLAYRDEMERRRLTDATLNLHIIAVNRYLKYISREDCMLKVRRVQRRRNLENVLSLEEYQEMLRYARDSGRSKHYYIMKTMASTGIRVSELACFTVEAIAVSRLYVRGKGKGREIYLPGQMQQELQGYCREEGIRTGVIFRGNGEAVISREAVYKMLQRIAAAVGVPAEKAHPHSLRHLFAKTYMEHYGNLAELADILGHSSLETTRIYTTSTAEEKCRRMGALGF